MTADDVRTEGLDGVELALLHLGCNSTLDNGNTLTTMDDIRTNAVTAEVLDRLDWKRAKSEKEAKSNDEPR